MSTNPTDGVRLQKRIAEMGLASRREAERWIEAGRVKVNNEVASIGDKVGPDDRITIDNKPVGKRHDQAIERQVIAYHKPVGEVVTRNDPEGRPTVFQKLPRLRTGRWIAVGRLDINTLGLLLFTTDGALANALMRPVNQVEREYAVRLLGDLPDERIQAMVKEGVLLDDGPVAIEALEYTGGEGANRWYHIVLREGRNRVVRRIFEAEGLTVSRLIRVRYGTVKLSARVKAGQYEELNDKQINHLLEAAGLPIPEKPRFRKGGGRAAQRPLKKAEKGRARRPNKSSKRPYRK